MSLPPGFLDELRNRVPVSRIVGRKVSWDLRKSNTGKGDFWAPCPFHEERTASFHVDDRKGFYYCFGCHAKGDALTFLREAEGLGFMEAVELLAGEAGMQMPARDPVAAQKADRREQLITVMEAAQRFHRGQLSGAAAANARAYLERRGLGRDAWERWGIGFAPPDRNALWRHLTGAGHAPELILEAGLCAKSERGGEPYDRFSARILFPIRDPRGRLIAYGGRSMDPEARAKYLNSPETPLFDKGRTLYNLDRARESLRKGGPLILAEGYMDVIALSEAGFHAVAPLGTAITEDQLRLAWRIAPEPVLALDGDKAGLRAGQRAAELALGLIGAQNSLRFALLPSGQDPDDLIRASGAGAMQSVLDQSRPLSQLIWEHETAGQAFDGPERRAALDHRLNELANRIQDPTLRKEYQREFGQLKAQLFSPRRAPRADFIPNPNFGNRGSAGQKFGSRFEAPRAALQVTRLTRLGTGDAAAAEELREARILVTLCAHPRHLAGFETPLWELEFQPGDHSRLQSLLLEQAALPALPDAATLAALAGEPLARLLARPEINVSPLLRPEAESEVVALCLAEDFARLRAERSALRETEEAEADMAHLTDEGTTWRLGQAAAARHAAGRASTESAGSDDEERSRLSAELQRMIDSQVWKKPGRTPK